MKTINKPIKTSVVDGQSYVDEPVYREVSKANELAYSINRGLGIRSVFPVIHELAHYEHVRLRWMEPDGRGGMRPRRA